MKRHATAIWNGALGDGKGTLTTQSGALDKHGYSFKARFEDESGKSGTNPEELLAAGRRLQRFWLTAAKLGLAMQPSLAPLAFASYAVTGTRFTEAPKLIAKAMLGAYESPDSNFELLPDAG